MAYIVIQTKSNFGLVFKNIVSCLNKSKYLL